MRGNLLLVSLLLFAFIVLMSFFSPHSNDAQAAFHSPQELAVLKNRIAIVGPGEYFLHSSHCRGCHGYDSAGVANVDENGNTVNLFDHWQSTMMANSARDPLWRAKVSHEILVDPGHAAELQDKCTSCHAPMGRYTSFYHGTPHYGLADLAVDTLGQDGVACESCHTISSAVGHTFSGDIPYDTTRNVYGPFQNPQVGPMQLYEGYTPVYSTHMDQARLCSSCHTLITQTADTSGNYTGGTFTEQATYHEYLNSEYPGDSITCQTCHMPHLNDPVVIANGFASLQPRYPFNQHIFAGANSFMLKIIKDHKVSLGSDAEDWKFDSTIEITRSMLMDSAITFNIQLDSSSNQTAYITARIKNKAGHKFPSGYPARRAVIQLIATDASGDTLLKSGTFTSDYHVAGENPSFEPHHNIISQSDVPQIYELVMGDVNGNFTSVLERAAMLLKDNRVPPSGFTTASSVYDTVLMSNDASADPDFNKLNLVEGTGSDFVHYQVPLAGVSGLVSFHAKVFYQSVPPKWVTELFTYSSAEIDSFRNYFNAADQTPVLIASDSLVNLGLSISNNLASAEELKVYPSLTSDGKVNIQTSPGMELKGLEVFDSEGRLVYRAHLSEKRNFYTFNLPHANSVYYMKIETGAGIFYRKVIAQY